MERDLDLLMVRKQIGIYPNDEVASSGTIKWSNGGEKMIKTPRNSNNNQHNQHNPILTEEQDNLNPNTNTHSNNKFTRDDINLRMGMRDMFIQTNSNPFLSNNDYIDDLYVRDNFLRAADSKTGYRQ